MRYLRATIMLLLMCCALPLWAQEAVSETPLPEASQEQRARSLFRELRCEVCAGQTIADSNAALAQDMRVRVRQLVAEGQSDEHILSYFAERYGADILMRPPLTANTAPLWLAPLVVLFLGLWFVLRYFLRSQRKET